MATPTEVVKTEPEFTEEDAVGMAMDVHDVDTTTTDLMSKEMSSDNLTDLETASSVTSITSSLEMPEAAMSDTDPVSDVLSTTSIKVEPQDYQEGYDDDYNLTDTLPTIAACVGSYNEQSSAYIKEEPISYHDDSLSTANHNPNTLIIQPITAQQFSNPPIGSHQITDQPMGDQSLPAYDNPDESDVKPCVEPMEESILSTVGASGSRSFLCGIHGCRLTFTEVSDVDAHIKATHFGNHRFSCGISGCGETFSRYSELVNHGDNHSAGELPIPSTSKGCQPPGSCGEAADRMCSCPHDDCLSQFPDEASLDTHMEEKHPESEDEDSSDDDDVLDQSLDKVIMGRKRKRKKITKYPCPEKGCSETCKTKLLLWRHQRSMHKKSKVKAFKCDAPGCEKEFPAKCKLRQHQKTHSAVRPFACENKFCHHAYKYKHQLERHQRSHMMRKRYPCLAENCGMSFTYKQEFIDHVAEFHDLCYLSQVRDEMKKRFKRRYMKYKCHFQGCGREFSLRVALYFHKRVHQDKKPYKCPDKFCKSAFRDACQLRRHQNCHAKGRRYPCMIKDCESSFNKLHELGIHVKRVHPGEHVFSCMEADCSNTYPSFPELKAHVTEAHPRREFVRFQVGGDENLPYRCDKKFCTRSFPSSDMLKRHQKRHSTILAHACPITGCDITFKHPRQVDLHIADVHRVARSFACPHYGCGESFTLYKLLKDHEDAAHQPLEQYLPDVNGRSRKFFCEECGRGFRAKNHLTKHYITHSDEMPFKCCACDKSFKRPFSLTMHKWRMHGIRDPAADKHSLQKKIEEKKEKVLTCTQCSSTFTTKAGFLAHQRFHKRANVKHTVTGDFPCRLITCLENGCGKTFTTSAPFFDHCSMEHSSTMIDTNTNHVCTLCNKSFKIQSYLARHMDRHQAERNHVCDTCGKAFKLQAYLKKHQKHHSEELNYACRQCDQRFKSSNMLYAHRTKVHRKTGQPGSGKRGKKS